MAGVRLRGTRASALRFDTVMKKWLRPPMTIMALLALLALVTPSFAWACPITGLTGNAAALCGRPADSPKAAAMTCCARMQKANANCMRQCCKPTPKLPAGDTDKCVAPVQSQADTAGVLSHLANASHAVILVSVQPLAPLTMEPSRGFSYGDAPSDSRLPAQNAPSALAGRAPPL